MAQNWTMLCQMISKCPDCKSVFDLPESHPGEHAEIVETHNRLEAESPALARMTTKMPYMCDECIEKRIKADEKALNDAKLRSARFHADAVSYGGGLLVPSVKEMTFAKSDPECERPNRGAWDYLYGWHYESNLWLCGDKGTGKTWGARCLLNRAIEHGKTAAEIDAAWLHTTAQAFNPDKWLKPRIDVDVLHVDDLDKKTLEIQGFEILWQIVDKRWQQKKRTIFTANADFRWFVSSSGPWNKFLTQNAALVESFGDRLRPFQVIRFEGQSLRQRVLPV